MGVSKSVGERRAQKKKKKKEQEQKRGGGREREKAGMPFAVRSHLSTRSNARFCVARPEPSLRPLELLSSPESGRAMAAAGVVVVAAASTPPPSQLDGRCIGAAAADIPRVRLCACCGESVGETARSVRQALLSFCEVKIPREGKKESKEINATCRILLFFERERRERRRSRINDDALPLFLLKRVLYLSLSPLRLSPSLSLFCTHPTMASAGRRRTLLKVIILGDSG